VPRKSLKTQLTSEFNDLLYGYPKRGGKRGGPSLREIAVLVGRRWRGNHEYTATGYFHPAELMIPLRVYGMCSFLADRLESTGEEVERQREELHRAAAAVKALRAARPRAFDRRFKGWSQDAWKNHWRQMAAFRHAATARRFKGREPWQFVFQVLWPREAEDYAFRAAQELGFPFDPTGLERNYRALEAKNRDLIQRAATWYGRNFWRWIERPELFPDEHWWRGVIWKAYHEKKRR
jgi:hypothetical protein